MSAPTRFAGTTGHPGKAAKTDTKTGICVGMVAENANYGKVTTKLPLKPKPSYRKGKLNKRVAFVKEVIREVAGFSPYEKRTLELLKVGKEKRALKLLKAKLGTRACMCSTSALRTWWRWWRGAPHVVVVEERGAGSGSFGRKCQRIRPALFGVRNSRATFVIPDSCSAAWKAAWRGAAAAGRWRFA